MGKPLIEEKVQEEVSYFLNQLQKGSSGGAVDPHKHLQTAICNIICSVVFGKRYEYSDPVFIKIVTLLDDMFQVNIPYHHFILYKYNMP